MSPRSVGAHADLIDAQNARMIRLGAASLLAQLALIGAASAPAGQVFNGTALIWSMAWLALGAVPGFLFGIPKVIQNGGAEPSGENGYVQRVNTNLEQVSDWLTKILIGVGLIEIAQLRTGVVQAGVYVSESLGSSASFASALILLCTVEGFGLGYLATRLFLPRAFWRADTDGILQQQVAAVSSVSAPLPDSQGPLSQEASEAADAIARTPFAELRAYELVPWAAAQRIRGNFADALRAARAAVQLNARDVRANLELGVALYHAREVEAAFGHLVRARDNLELNAERRLAPAVYGWLTFVSLWRDPPGGFTDALTYGEEFLTRKLPLGDGAVLVNLAAAYGQKAQWLIGEQKGTIDDVMPRALEVLKLAAAFDRGRWKERLRELMISDQPSKSPADDDLEVFEREAQFRAALDLPE